MQQQADKQSSLYQQTVTRIQHTLLQNVDYAAPTQQTLQKHLSQKTRLDYSPQLERLLAQANDHLLDGNHTQAITILQQVIKLEPRLPEAYDTLGIVFEDMGNHADALEVFFLAAHHHKDIAVWKRIALMAIRQKDFKKAVYCLSKAARNPKDMIWAITTRSKILFQSSQREKAIADLQKLSKRITDPVVATTLALMLCEVGKDEDALEMLEDYFAREGPWVTRVCTFLVKLYIQHGEYNKCSEFIVRAEFQLSEFSMELVALQAVCEIYRKNIPRARISLQRLYSGAGAVRKDIYFDVIDALISKRLYSEALVCLDHMNTRYDIPEVWHMKAVCYDAIGDENSALVYAEKAVDAEPGRASYCLTLSEIYRKLGDATKALRALDNVTSKKRVRSQSTEQIGICSPSVTRSSERKSLMKPEKRKKKKRKDFSTEILTPEKIDVLVQKSKVLLEEEKIGDFVDCCFDSVMSQLKVIHGQRSHRNKKAPEVFHNQDFMEIVIALMKALSILNRSEPALTIGENLVRYEFEESELKPRSREWIDEMIHEVRTLTLGLALTEENYGACMEVVKYLLAQDPRNEELLAILGRVLCATHYPSAHKVFLKNLTAQVPDSYCVRLMQGHLYNKHNRSSYRFYSEALSMAPDEPIVLVCRAAASLISGLITSSRRAHQHIVEAFSLLYKLRSLYRLSEDEDLRKRGECECLYNIGLAFHLMGMNNHAIQCYNAVLAKNHACVRQAAHNLSNLYVKSGSEELARRLVIRYNSL